MRATHSRDCFYVRKPALRQMNLKSTAGEVQQTLSTRTELDVTWDATLLVERLHPREVLRTWFLFFESSACQANNSLLHHKLGRTEKYSFVRNYLRSPRRTLYEKRSRMENHNFVRNCFLAGGSEVARPELHLIAKIRCFFIACAKIPS